MEYFKNKIFVIKKFVIKKVMAALRIGVFTLPMNYCSEEG